MSSPMNRPRTPPADDRYREGWERVFGGNKKKARLVQEWEEEMGELTVEEGRRFNVKTYIGHPDGC